MSGSHIDQRAMDRLAAAEFDPAVEAARAARSTDQTRRLVALHRSLITIRRPAGWHVADESRDGGRYVHQRDQATVIWSITMEDDGRPWLHVSTSRAGRPPTPNELAAVKDVFVGADRYAYQVFPPRDMHVNINAHVLHLWAPMEGPPPLPEFSTVINGVRTI